MFSARSAAMDADYPRPGPVAAGKNAAVETFIQYAVVKAHLTYVAFLAACG